MINLKILFTPPVAATLLILVIVSMTILSRSSQSAQKLAALDLGDRRNQDLIVTLDFEPESYHITLLQNKGRLVGVDGSTVRMRKVSNEDLMTLSRLTWVNNFEIWAEGESQ